MLPNSITKLCNLQTLKLSDCFVLKELPKDLSRLVKLRVLEIDGCYGLDYMPRGMGKLSSLERLKGWYLLGNGGKKFSSWEELFYGLEDLNTLNNLKGTLEIRIGWPENAKIWNAEGSWREGSKSCLKGMEHITGLWLDVNLDRPILELLIEELQPHSNLKRLYIWCYTGVKMPGWFSNATSLPHLVDIQFTYFTELEYLPLLLPSLKKIYLLRMPNLRGVGMEESNSNSNSNSNSPEMTLLPCLSELTIDECPKLKCLRIIAPQLSKMSMRHFGCLDSIPMETLKSIQILRIQHDYEMVQLPNWIQHCSSLEEFRIRSCQKLQTIPNWMPKLTSLQKLNVEYCSSNLKRRCQRDPPGEDWLHIQHIPHITFYESSLNRGRRQSN